jgi:DNA replication protein DnaC
MEKPFSKKEAVKCEFCDTLVPPFEFGGYFIYQRICSSDKCKEQLRLLTEREEQAEARRKAMARNKDFIYPPPAFADTDINQFAPRLRALVESWNYERGSLIIHGQTRYQKTRAAWLILIKVQDSGHKCISMTMRDFELIIEQGYEAGDHAKRLKRVCDIEFLMIDDMGKERPTPRMATDLFQVIDFRTSHKLPTVITTNFDSAGLERRFADVDRQLASALVARLKEFFTAFGSNGT